MNFIKEKISEIECYFKEIKGFQSYLKSALAKNETDTKKITIESEIKNLQNKISEVQFNVNSIKQYICQIQSNFSQKQSDLSHESPISNVNNAHQHSGVLIEKSNSDFSAQNNDLCQELKDRNLKIEELIVQNCQYDKIIEELMRCRSDRDDHDSFLKNKGFENRNLHTFKKKGVDGSKSSEHEGLIQLKTKILKLEADLMQKNNQIDLLNGDIQKLKGNFKKTTVQSSRNVNHGLGSKGFVKEFNFKY